MSLFSDIGNFVSSAVSTVASAAMDVAQVAFPPLAIASSLGNMVTQGLGQGLGGLLGQLTQGGGMPGFIGKEIGNLIHSVIGQLTQPSDPACNQQCHESFGDEVGDFINKLLGSVAQDTCDGAGGAKGGSSGGSWFEALAKALGKALDKQAADVKSKSDAVQGQNAQDNPSGFTDLQSASQRMSFMMSAADQVIKSIGEGLNSLARKQ